MSAEGAQQGQDPNFEPGDDARELSEEELRAAYEEELNRITSTDLMAQAAVSLLNLGGRRLGVGGGGPDSGEAPGAGRDLEQVRDAIDGVRALLEVLERRLSNELGPLRDALSQLQFAYAREAQAGASSAGDAAAAGGSAGGQSDDQPGATGGAGEQQAQRGPGPAEASGRLWVPGR
jgi:hypothetical protein